MITRLSNLAFGNHYNYITANSLTNTPGNFLQSYDQNKFIHQRFVMFVRDNNQTGTILHLYH